MCYNTDVLVERQHALHALMRRNGTEDLLVEILNHRDFEWADLAHIYESTNVIGFKMDDISRMGGHKIVQEPRMSVVYKDVSGVKGDARFGGYKPIAKNDDNVKFTTSPLITSISEMKRPGVRGKDFQKFLLQHQNEVIREAAKNAEWRSLNDHRIGLWKLKLERNAWSRQINAQRDAASSDMDVVSSNGTKDSAGLVVHSSSNKANSNR